MREGGERSEDSNCRSSFITSLFLSVQKEQSSFLSALKIAPIQLCFVVVVLKARWVSKLLSRKMRRLTTKNTFCEGGRGTFLLLYYSILLSMFQVCTNYNRTSSARPSWADRLDNLLTRLDSSDRGRGPGLPGATDQLDHCENGETEI